MGGYIQEVQADAPVLWYRFKEESGTAVNDSSGNSITGKYEGTSVKGSGPIVNGNYREVALGAGKLHGTGTNFVSIPEAAPLHLSEAVTMEIWIWPLTSENFVIFEEAEKATGSANLGYSILVESSKLEFRIGNATTFKTATGGVVTKEAWNHLACTYDGANIRTFLNGVEGTPETMTGAIRTVKKGWIGLLSSTAGGGELAFVYAGRWAEAAIYKTVLSPTRINAHFEARNTFIQETKAQLPYSLSLEKRQTDYVKAFAMKARLLNPWLYLDPLEGYVENTLSKGGKWQQLGIANNTGGVEGRKAGGWGSGSAFPNIGGVYWTETEYPLPIVVAIRVIEKVGSNRSVGLYVCLKKGSPTTGYQAIIESTNAEGKKWNPLIQQQNENVAEHTSSGPEFTTPNANPSFAFSVTAANILTLWVNNNQPGEEGGTDWKEIVGGGGIIHDTTFTEGFVGFSASGNVLRLSQFEVGKTLKLIKVESPGLGRTQDLVKLTPTLTFVKTLTGKLEFSKRVSAATTAIRGAALQLTVILGHNFIPALKAVLAFSVARTKTTTKTQRPSTLNFSFSWIPAIAHKLQSELPFSVIENRIALKVRELKAALEFAFKRALLVQTQRPGSLTPQGTVTHSVFNLTLQAVATFTSTVTHNVTHAPKATLEFTEHIAFRILSFLLKVTFTPTTKMPTVIKPLAKKATLAFSTSTNYVTVKGRAVILEFSKQMNLNYVHQLRSKLEFTFKLNRTIQKIRQASLELRGSLGRNTFHRLSATLELEGKTNRAFIAAVKAVFAFSGRLKQGSLRIHQLPATLQMSVRLGRAIKSTQRAVFTLVGRAEKVVPRHLTATLELPGKVTRATTRRVQAVLKFVGVVPQEIKVRKLLALFTPTAKMIGNGFVRPFKAILTMNGRVDLEIYEALFVVFGPIVNFFKGVDKLIEEIPSAKLVSTAFKLENELGDYPEVELDEAENRLEKVTES